MFINLKLVEECKALILGSAALKQAISCARCYICNEKLLDQDWETREIDDESELVHTGCINDK